MSSLIILKKGLGRYRELLEAGFNPYIMGSAWLKLKRPKYDILVRDFDIYCPDFDPSRSPFDIERLKSQTASYETPNHLLTIIKQFEWSTVIEEEEDLEMWHKFHMIKNSCWLAGVLNKVANYISRPPSDPFRLMDEFSILIPLVNCYIFYFTGLEFDSKRVAWILRRNKFTNSRIAHLYRDNVAYGAAVLASKYYLPQHQPEEILTEFCNKVIKPICIELGVYDAESCEPSMGDNK